MKMITGLVMVVWLATVTVNHANLGLKYAVYLSPNGTPNCAMNLSSQTLSVINQRQCALLCTHLQETSLYKCHENGCVAFNFKRNIDGKPNRGICEIYDWPPEQYYQVDGCKHYQVCTVTVLDVVC